jgi:hypothetical protein
MQPNENASRDLWIRFLKEIRKNDFGEANRK